MTVFPRLVRAPHQILHGHMLELVIFAYVLAAGFPGPGLRIKDACLGDVSLGAVRLRATVPSVLLGFLLFGAGWRVRSDRIRELSRRPGMMLAGLIANVSVPVLYLLAIMPVLGWWHNADEVAIIVTGLAIVASMPVAGSSTGWAQHAGGDMALSLGLVVASTLISPLSTPMVLRLMGRASPAAAAVDLHILAGRETGTFLAAWVLVPSLLGIAVRRFLPERLVGPVERHLKPLTTTTLLILCYANASACLPQVFKNPDWDFLGAVTVAVVGMCGLTFFAGYLLGRLMGADHPQRAALMFGMGMNNNGTGLVLASAALAARPVVLLPMIAYNLGQHLVAGCVDRITARHAVHLQPDAHWTGPGPAGPVRRASIRSLSTSVRGRDRPRP